MAALIDQPRKLAAFLKKLDLAFGGHSPDGVMCVMEATAFIAGEPWSDEPACTSPVIAAFLRSWNDSLPDADRQRLKRFIPLVVGTRTTAADEQARAWLATDWLVRTFTPAWLDKAGLIEHAAKLRAVPALTSGKLAEAAKPIINEAKQASAAAGAAARAAAGAAAGDAAWAAAGAAAGVAAWDAAWAAAGAAARDTAWAAAGAAARAAAWDAARDAAGAAAGVAAWDAAWDAASKKKGYSAQYNAAKRRVATALTDTISLLQASAETLVEQMCAVGR